MSRRLLRGAVVLALCGAPYACTIVNGLEVPQRGDAGSGGGKLDACVVSDVRAPTDSGTLGDGGPPLDGVYAVRKVTFSTGTFDSNNVALCPKVSPICTKPPGVLVAPATTECANSAGTAVKLLSATYSVEDRYNRLAAEGKGSALFRLQRAVGTDRMIVSFYPSPGRDVCGTYIPPKWDGTDIWDLDSATLKDIKTKFSLFAAQTSSPAGAPFATVQMPAVELRASSDFVLRLENPTITFRFGPDGAPVEVLAVGRWGLNESFRALRLINIGADGHPICKDPLDDEVRKFLCGSRDITSVVGASGLCDSISMAIAMELSPARLGEARSVAVLPESCTDRPPPSPLCP